MSKINMKNILIGSIAILSIAWAILHKKTNKSKPNERKDDIGTLLDLFNSPISFDTKNTSEPSTLVKAFTYPGNFWYWMIKGSYEYKK